MLSVSDKYDSVNERTHEIGESMKLHILGCGKMATEFIRQSANKQAAMMCRHRSAFRHVISCRC